MFAVGGIIIAWLLAKTGEWVWGYFGKPNSLVLGVGSVVVASIIAFMCWRNENIFGLASEVTTELKKVTWPTRQETMYSTIIVIVTTIVSSAFLGIFDGVWSWVTRQIYG